MEKRDEKEKHEAAGQSAAPEDRNEIGRDEVRLPDGRACRRECWMESGITYVTMTVPAGGMEDLTQEEVFAYLKKQELTAGKTDMPVCSKKVCGADGGAYWAATVALFKGQRPSAPYREYPPEEPARDAALEERPPAEDETAPAQGTPEETEMERRMREYIRGETGAREKMSRLMEEPREEKLESEHLAILAGALRRAREHPERPKPAEQLAAFGMAPQAAEAGAARRDKRADIVIGVPASGRSTVFVSPLRKEHGSRVIDSEAAMAAMPGYENGRGLRACSRRGTPFPGRRWWAPCWPGKTWFCAWWGTGRTIWRK